MIEPLRIGFQVECPAEHAFDVWTRRISTWWPVSHSVTGEKVVELKIAAHFGVKPLTR